MCAFFISGGAYLEKIRKVFDDETLFILLSYVISLFLHGSGVCFENFDGGAKFLLNRAFNETVMNFGGNRSNMVFFKLIWLENGFFSAFGQKTLRPLVWVSDREDSESPLQMIGQGNMSMGASYGHLQFPIKIQLIQQSFDDLEDVVEAYERHTLYGGAVKALRDPVSRLHSKVSMLKGFVSPGEMHLSIKEHSINLLEDALTRQQFLAREKKSTMKILQWMGLAGFGSLLYTAGQLTALKRDLESISTSQSTIAQTMDFQSLRTSNLANYIKAYHRLIIEAISQVSLGSKKVAMEIHGWSVQLALETFKGEIRDLFSHFYSVF